MDVWEKERSKEERKKGKRGREEWREREGRSSEGEKGSSGLKSYYPVAKGCYIPLLRAFSIGPLPAQPVRFPVWPMTSSGVPYLFLPSRETQEEAEGGVRGEGAEG